MGLLVTTVVAAATWIVLLSLGIKPFDALLVAILMVFLAATAHLLARYLPGNRREVRPADRYTPR
jgi:Mn2+/Fe2+ NRAMP family transporter